MEGHLRNKLHRGGGEKGIRRKEPTKQTDKQKGKKRVRVNFFGKI